MKWRRLVVNAQDVSFFEPLQPDLANVAGAGEVPAHEMGSILQPRQAVFVRLPAGWQGAWHPVPCRQYYLFLSGRLHIEGSGGDSEDFSAGDVLLMENTRGRGHRSTVVGPRDVTGMLMQLA